LFSPALRVCIPPAQVHVAEAYENMGLTYEILVKLLEHVRVNFPRAFRCVRLMVDDSSKAAKHIYEKRLSLLPFVIPVGGAYHKEHDAVPTDHQHMLAAPGADVLRGAVQGSEKKQEGMTVRTLQTHAPAPLQTFGSRALKLA
jgi:hypothetical protein